MKKDLVKGFLHIVASDRFFAFTVAALVVQAAWIAACARYPLPFDESFHFGIIQIYAGQWLPVLTSQPFNPGAYGELVHDPSYLFHYLMSFPYRITDFLFHNLVISVGALRFIDIALFALGLFGFRKLLLRVGASRVITHVIIFIIMLVPVSSLLAAQINYDNMLFAATPVFLWYTLNVIDEIKKKRQLTYKNIVLMVTAGTLTSLIKYAFLPIFVVTIIYVAVMWLKSDRRVALLKSLKKSFATSERKIRIGCMVALVVSVGLFLQRYAYNAVVYHAVQPDCAQVLTVKQCMQYGPWSRNYALEQKAKTTHSNLSAPARNPVVFARGWYHAMIYRMYFVIDQDFNEYTPLPLPFVAAFVFGSIGIVLTVVYIKRIAKSLRYTWLFVVIIVAYCASLFLLNYQEYLRFGSVVAVNGRYLMPVLPLALLLFAMGYREFINDIGGKYKLGIVAGLLIIIGILMIDGGGILGFLIHSTAKWYLPNDPLTGVSLWLGGILRQVVLGGINEPIDHLINNLLK